MGTFAFAVCPTSLSLPPASSPQVEMETSRRLGKKDFQWCLLIPHRLSGGWELLLVPEGIKIRTCEQIKSLDGSCGAETHPPITRRLSGRWGLIYHMESNHFLENQSRFHLVWWGILQDFRESILLRAILSPREYNTTCTSHNFCYYSEDHWGNYILSPTKGNDYLHCLGQLPPCLPLWNNK